VDKKIYHKLNINYNIESVEKQIIN
jgi:hypothetical protein